MGESDVSAAKVGKVIQTVTSHLTGKKLELAELPSKTTALHFADIGHALTKIQIFDEITSQRFDLHLDGTSRDHKKVVGHQVTLQDRRQLSLGFTPVDREDSKTLVDVTMNLFYEIASVMTLPEDEMNKLVKDIYSNLTSTMTDRAATMKAFSLHK